MRRSKPADRSRSADDGRFALLLAAAYFVVAGILAWRHELWRDELESLATIRGNSLGEVLSIVFDTNVYFYVLFAWVKLFAGSAASFQIFHLLAATAAVLVFARCAPFGRGQKILFAFGYFTLFEFGIIARDYPVASLLILGTTAAIARKRKRPVLTVFLLLLLANHSLFAAFVAAGLTAYVVLDLRVRAREGRVSPSERRRLRAAVALLLVGGVGLIWEYQHLATARGGQLSTVEQASVGTTLRAVWNAYVPLPDFSTEHF